MLLLLNYDVENYLINCSNWDDIDKDQSNGVDLQKKTQQESNHD